MPSSNQIGAVHEIMWFAFLRAFVILHCTVLHLVATIGSGMGSQLGTARLLYAMGRGNAIPKSFFGALDPVRQIPRNNVAETVGQNAIGAGIAV